MLDSIEALCAATHNYHETDRVIDDYAIENGNISLPFLVAGQFFRIVGSKFNDGVYIYSEDYIFRDATWDDVLKDNRDWNSITEEEWGELKHVELIDEEFHGGVWPMRMPRAFLTLAKEIEEYNSSEAAKASPYISESISGHYSYTKANNHDNAWESVFSVKLKRWRKVANI